MILRQSSRHIRLEDGVRLSPVKAGKYVNSRNPPNVGELRQLYDSAGNNHGTLEAWGKRYALVAMDRLGVESVRK